MNNNSKAFTTFRGQLTNKKQLANGDETFKGRVVYTWNEKSLRETLIITLRLTTWEYGQVCINEGEKLCSEIVHMVFNSKYQTYVFNNEGFLIIKGDSERLGPYEVKIIQI